MNPASTTTSPERPGRAASAEPSSIRPNPFDDDDDSSRKRRRTSLSDSPAASLEAPAQVYGSSSSTTPYRDLAASIAGEASRDGPQGPRTPEEQCSSPRPRAEPQSSKVTINLRNNQQSREASTSPPSPTPNSRTNASHDRASNIKTSVENVEVDMVAPPSPSGHDTPGSSSSLSQSPPVELVTAPSDEDMASDRQSVEMVAEDDDLLVDPINDFPFTEPDETPMETIQRLTQYLSTQPMIDDNILDPIEQWFSRYVRYTKTVDLESAFISCRQHEGFWLTFPDVILAMTCRKPPLTKSLELRPIVLSLYSHFAVLSAWFVTLDNRALRAWHSPTQTTDRSCPELFSPGYLQQLHALIRPRLSSELVVEPDFQVLRPDDGKGLLREFHRSKGGSIESLSHFATDVAEASQTFPKMADSLFSACQIAADIMAESAFLPNTAHYGSVASQRLEIGHRLHDTVADMLTKVIDKSVTQLSSDSVFSLVQALSDMLRISLTHGCHPLAAEALQAHRHAHPLLPHKHTIEAIIWGRRFTFLAKLIRISQMQLRVIAVTTMCSDLVACWKRQCEAGDDAGSAYVDHLANVLLRSELVEYILGPSCHPEITVESANIIGFLVVTKMYREEHIDLLWRGITSSQDPRMADALTRMITTIINLFDYNGLVSLCDRLRTLPVEGFTPSIRVLWEGILRQMCTRPTSEGMTLSFHPYDLCLRLLRDSSIQTSGSQVSHPDIQQAAMQKFKELLVHGPDEEGRRQLYLSCIKDIEEKSATTLGSLWCLAMAIRPTMVQSLRLLIEEHDLARLIVDELEHAVETGKAVGNPVVLFGNANQPRRDFITNIIYLEPRSIADELGERLWDLMVGPKSPGLDDRRSGWNILNNTVKRATFKNPFLQSCLSIYVPALPSSCLCTGTLDFVRQEIVPRIGELGDLVLDDQNMVATSGIEQLWRLVLNAEDPKLVDQAVRTLAGEVYIDSWQIASNSLQRTRAIHYAFVNRCIQQLREAACRIKASSDGTQSGDDEPMVIVETEEQAEEQERVFTRSLKLLHYFLQAHQSRPFLAAPDLRTLISPMSWQIEGDSAELKYQSFDGDSQTEVKALSIGKLNTAASLLASLRQETGFDNYRVYYRGRPFLPSEQETCKSLEDLRIHDGLILVKKEEDRISPSSQVKPGASSLEVEIAAHFDEIWEYLSMEEKLAQEIYHFLVQLPTGGHLMKALESHEAAYRDIFPRGQPFKSLYAMNVILDHAEAVTRRRNSEVGEESVDDDLRKTTITQTLQTALSLIVQAISDDEILYNASASVSLQLSTVMMQALLHLLRKITEFGGFSTLEGYAIPNPERLVDILSQAIAKTDETCLHLIATTLATILRLGVMDHGFWESVGSNSTFPTIIGEMLLTDTRSNIRAIASKQIEEILAPVEALQPNLTSVSTIPPSSPYMPMVEYFWGIVSSCIPQTPRWPSQCDEIFRLAHSLILSLTTSSSKALDLPELVSRISQLLVDHVSTEDVGNIGPEDLLARGLASMLHLCLRLDESVATSPTLPADLAETIFSKHLYPAKRSMSEEPVPKVILHGETRAKLSEIIFTLVKHDKEQVNCVLEWLNGLVPFYHDDEDEPYLYELPYHFDRTRALRAPCGYSGLLNLSNTCYLNSLLTQLFMNTNFRQFMLTATVRDPANTQQLLFYTQKLFGYMQESYTRYVDPSAIVASIKTYEDTLIDIHNQMDVDEFYQLLFDRWEGQFLVEDDRKRLRSFYGGQLVQQVKSKECNHISERLEPFSAIQCDIKGKSSLEESLQAYVDGEIMEGDNKYKCSTCDRHVDAIKRACLKDIPDNVIFHLKRFDFNVRTMQRSKINDYFSFPARVNLRPYTIEHLDDDESDDNEEDVFELVGVLVHSGTAESGHYYSYIRERPTNSEVQNWVEFNDDMVSPWDPASMQSSTFGGPDSRPPFESSGITYDKSYSAYMLFYQRASSLKDQEDSMREQSSPTPHKVNMSSELKEQILGENTVLLRRHCLFEPSHTRLVQMLFNRAMSMAPGEWGQVKPMSSVDDFHSDHDFTDLAMQTALSHLDQVVTRVKDTADFSIFSRMISDAILSNPENAYSLYEYFGTRREAMRALLQRNPDPSIRLFTGKAYVWSLERISKEFSLLYDAPEAERHAHATRSRDNYGKAMLGNDVKSHFWVIDGAVELFKYLWRFFQIHIRAWDEYFMTLLGFAALGTREVAHLLSESYLGKLLRIISADTMMDLPNNYSRMLQAVMKRLHNNNRPPSYVKIIQLASHLLHQLEPQLGPETIVDDPAERLERMEAPFNWSSEEISLIHLDMEENSLASVFVEKLLEIDQAHEATDGIIRLLVGTGPQMDMKVLQTLRRCIRGETSTQAMDPFLRAASAYLQSTEQLDNATRMVQHVFSEAKSLQNNEGAYFLDFYRTALHLSQQDEHLSATIRTLSLKMIPNWGPLMLLYPDASIRSNTGEFLERELFRFAAHEVVANEDTVPEHERQLDRQAIILAMKQLGIQCLVHLQDTYVRRRIQLRRVSAAPIIVVIEECCRVLGMNPETQQDMDMEFMTLHREVMEPFRRLVVDEIEEDASDWDGSCESDQVDDIAQMSAPSMNELNGSGPA